MDIQIKLLHPWVLDGIADPSRDVFGVWISDHPSCKPGVPRRIAFTGEKTETGGNVCFIAQHFLEPSEQEEVVKFVGEWQKNDEAMAGSRKDKEVTL